MKYPNLRYGNPAELAFHVRGARPADVARRLRRSERTIRNWLTGAQRVPWWVPEIIRLQNMEHAERLRQMNAGPVRARLGLVSGDVLSFPVPQLVTAPDTQKPHGLAVGAAFSLDDPGQVKTCA